MEDTQRSPTISTQLQRIAEQAARYPERAFTSLAHLLDVDMLREAFRRTHKDRAPGVDGVTAQEYAEHLEENLAELHTRLHSQRYNAPPVKRAWADKDDGSQRPLGMPVFEDKIVQRAVSMVMNAVYEQDFYDFSHGFREKHSPHQALKELREKCYKLNINWIVDADVTGFFDNLDHGLIREFIRKRVKDGGLLRLIGKWLNAGVLDGEELYYPDKGSPQGGVISPLIANVFLHYVLDEWYAEVVKPRLRGRSFLIRFADDFVIGCEFEEDARRIMAVFPKRFGRYKLAIHPEKTRLIEFGNPDQRKGQGDEPNTFDFLGFTHYWAKSRRGYWVMKRRTVGKRLRRALKALWRWCHYNRHMNLKEQHRILCAKLHGHYNYYGIRSNYRQLWAVWQRVRRAWRYWLGKRHRNGKITLARYDKLLETYPLPRPRIVHSI